MAQAQEDENHWPGFVDALSTIVMVVTFLLIILAIAIFVMSLQIAKGFADNNTTDVLLDTSTNMKVSEKVIVESTEEVDVPSDASAVAVIDADDRFFFQFDGLTIALDDDSAGRLMPFVEKTEPIRDGRKYVVQSYFDPSIGYTKAKRLAYYRMLAVRGALSENGVAAEEIEIYVREAPTLDRINTVEIVTK